VKRTLIVIALAAVAAGAVAFLFRGSHGATAATRPQQLQRDELERRIAAPGVVEAASEEIAIRAETSGRLISVPVEEGDRVARGEIVAKLDQSLARAQVEAAGAEVKLRQADLTAVLNGANQLQRLEVWVHMKQAETAVAEARAEYDRRKKLFEEGAIPKEEVERAQNALTLAEQRSEEATLHRRMIGAKAVDTDRQRAEAALAAAKANLDEARALFAKTIIRAPLAGVVVHKYLKSGELAAEVSGPILAIADVSHLRVRAEIDEADVGALRLGEESYVTAPAYGDHRFKGHVIRIASELGRKRVTSGDPAERIDAKVLETLIDLDPGVSLPLGLRVTCFIRTGQ
jgi:HlyD family secretion protein